MIKGFIIMGARPLHKGHEALIDYGKSNCDKLIIFVSDPRLDNEIPLKYRLHWVLSTYLDDPQIEVYGDYVDEPINISYDDKSKWWGEYIKNRFPGINRVFSSEPYGELFAKTIGAESFIFNQGRSIIPVSATMIRNKPLTNWDLINSFAKDYFVKKICIIGTESTGKTVLCKQLAEHYNTVWVPEKGRELIKDTETCTSEDLKIVGLEHAKSIKKHLRLANKVLFMDTDVNITKSYAKYLFNEDLTFEPWIEEANKADLYIYLGKNAPYVDDGTRLPIEQRNELDKFHEKEFMEIAKNKTIIQFSCHDGYQSRFSNIINEINKFIEKY